MSKDLTQLSSKTYIQFQDVLETMIDAFVALDSNWCYTYVNTKAAQIFNRTQQYLIGKHIWTEFPEGVGQPFYDAYYQAVEERITITLEEYYPPYDRWFENRIYPLKDGVAIFFTDVTQRKMEQETVQNLNIQLEEKNKALLTQEEELLAQQEHLNDFIEELRERNFELDQIIYKTSHDIRSPLVSILGLLEIIKQEKDPAQIELYHKLIENRVKKLDDFVNSMLNFSKINRSDVTLEFIDLNELIHKCIQHLKFVPHFPKIQKTVLVEGEAFRNDLLRLEMIFNNILSNSIKYANPAIDAPFVHTHVQVNPTQAEITVKDNGIGIREEYTDRIFDMFFKGTEKSDGSGLGLYIVKQIVEKLGGSIWVSSNLGEGTEIKVIVPNRI